MDFCILCTISPTLRPVLGIASGVPPGRMCSLSPACATPQLVARRPSGAAAAHLTPRGDSAAAPLLLRRSGTKFAASGLAGVDYPVLPDLRRRFHADHASRHRAWVGALGRRTRGPRPIV